MSGLRTRPPRWWEFWEPSPPGWHRGDPWPVPVPAPVPVEEPMRPLSPSGAPRVLVPGAWTQVAPGVHVWAPHEGTVYVRAVDDPDPVPSATVCDGSMVHNFDPDPAGRIRAGFDIDGHPPNCPANITRATHRVGPPAPAPRVDVSRITVAPMTARQTGPGAFVLEATPPPCTCGARPGQGHLLRCSRWDT